MAQLSRPGHRQARKGVESAWVVSLPEAVGGLAGHPLDRVDSRLVRSRSESPATEMMICRRC